MVETAIPHLGETIGGKYRVERALGRGGMGAVFEVTHCVTHKHFAIKWLMSEPSSSSDAVTRFVREAQVAGRCEHRNIVEVYDIDRHNGQLFMVMELLKGESLAERLLRCSTGIAYREACRLLVPCMEAIADAHASGIIHRDLKPANIFICQARGREPEFAKVLDFGVSRFVTPDGQFEIGSQTRSGAIIGTPFYMAPEQMRGHPIDARADVYSMGVTLYETLTGRRPYDATSYGDLLLKVADARPPSVSNVIADVPQPLCEVVMRAMATDPAKRYASISELARELEPFSGIAMPNHTPSLSWSPSTQFTPLVSETPSAHDLAESVGARRSAGRKALWIALAAVVVLGVIAWRVLSGDEGNVVKAGSPATSTAAATSAEHEVLPAAPVPAVQAAQESQGDDTPEPSAIPPHGTDVADGTNATALPQSTTSRREPGAAGPSGSSSSAAREVAAPTPSAERGRPNRKKRQEQVEPSQAAPQEGVPTTPRNTTRRKARAPAHMERSEF